jgi:hypothetical protein
VSETKRENSDRALLKALADWPTREISEEEWESRAEAISERVAQGAAGTTSAHISDEILFSPALPSTPEEGHNSAPARASAGAIAMRSTPSEGKMGRPERERRSFSELARMAQTPPPSGSRPSQPPAPPSGVIRAAEAKTGDSGVVDLKAAIASDPMVAARAAQTPLASAGIFDDDDHVAPPLSQRSGTAGPVSQPVPSSAAVSGVQGQGKKAGRGGAVFGTVIALVAVAAGAFFVVRQRHASAPAPAAASPSAVEEPIAANTPPAAPPAATAPADDGLTVTPVGDDTANKAVAKAGPIGGGAKVAAGKAAPAKNDKPNAAQAPDPKLVAKDLPASQPASSGPLGDAIKSSLGAGANANDSQTPTPAADSPQFSAGSVPQKPSQGAVTGALGAALPGARACLSPDDPVSKATVTFASAGTVQSVVVTGAATGKPAEACIRTALGKAKVPPFAQPTYSATVTVRPNN